MRNGNRRVLAGVLLALALGSVLRCAWLTADHPTNATLGIVWHDEGAWVHNARNRALWGSWRTDEWNPVFIAPVFTAFEYAAFGAFGVGTWQARTVPVASGLLAVAALAAGLFTIAGRRAALIGATLLATNYVFVMWNRAALMESTMTAFIVVAWAAYALAARRPVWGVVAGTAATLAWFSKAAAAFFGAAIVLDAVVTLLAARAASVRGVLGIERPTPAVERGAIATLAGLGLSAGLIGAFFVLPYWNEYQFYNWQVSVSRKPSYSFHAVLDRASWLPIVHDFFTRMWLTMVAATIAVIGLVTRSRTAAPAERLIVSWLVLGLLELVVHDAGNERRYVMFIPALIGLSALALGATGPLFHAADETRWRRWAALPVVALLAYLAIGSLVRLAFLADIRNSDFSTTVRLSAALAASTALAILVKWRALVGWFSRQTISPRGALLVASLVVVGDLAQYVQWVRGRTFDNHRASIEVGRLLPPGTLVQGKLANGLALENGIRPVFIGRGFGNYDDRTTRPDVRYVLTYISPSLGFESQRQNPVIKDVLDACPGWRIVSTFEVRETEGGRDRAALIDKFAGDARSARHP
jgi:4-amino-4-deoxy-L-arabinose transferase-like glycosyltransferase